MLYAFDPIINEAANWHYMSGGATSVPVVFWGVVNRGGEQAAQHSQALHSISPHVRGSSGRTGVAVRCQGLDAVGDRRRPRSSSWMNGVYGIRRPVPRGALPGSDRAGFRQSGRGRRHRRRVLADGPLRARRCRYVGRTPGISCEVVDRGRSSRRHPLVASSVRKTGRALVCDIGWRTGGIGGKISAQIAESCWNDLRAGSPPGPSGYPRARGSDAGGLVLPAPASGIVEENRPVDGGCGDQMSSEQAPAEPPVRSQSPRPRSAR